MNIHNNKLRTISWILLGAFSFQGCTSYHTYEKGTASALVSEINQKAETINPKIYMNDGYDYSATNLHFRPDTSFWYAGGGVLQVDHLTSDINKITFIDRSKGARNGFLVFAGLGFVIGATMSYAIFSPSFPGDDNASVGEVLLGGVLVAAFSGIVGAALGWTIGEKATYTISDPKTIKGQ